MIPGADVVISPAAQPSAFCLLPVQEANMHFGAIPAHPEDGSRDGFEVAEVALVEQVVDLGGVWYTSSVSASNSGGLRRLLLQPDVASTSQPRS